MTDHFKAQLQQAHEQGDYASLLHLIPYAKLIGVECSRVGDEVLFRLPANKDNIGNPLLPAIHGGVIAGFMELSAALHLLIFTGSPGVPVKISKCRAAASSMKPAITPPWMAGNKGLPMLSLFAGSLNSSSSPTREHSIPISPA